MLLCVFLPSIHLTHVLECFLPIPDLLVVHLVTEHGCAISIGLGLPCLVFKHESVLPVSFAGITDDDVFVATTGVFHELVEAIVRGAATLVIGYRAFISADSDV
jgi:hypothetical protein